MNIDSLGTNLLKHLGWFNGPGAAGSLVPPSNSDASEQKSIEDFTKSGIVADPNVWEKYSTNLKRPVTLDQTLTLWEEMATWDLMSAALTEIVDEVIQHDSADPGTLWIESNNEAVAENCNEMLKAINLEDIIASQVWYVAGLGNAFEKIDYMRGDGVTGLTFVHPMDCRRYWLQRNRRCVGFQWKTEQPDKSDIFVMPDNTTPVPRAGLSLPGSKIEDLWYPWDFMHFRRMFRMRSSEYGEAIYDEAQGIYKKLRMAVDQMVVHRAQIQPDRYVVEIDVADQPPAEQLRTVKRWKSELRSKMSFGSGSSPGALADPTSFNSYYSAWGLDSVLYMARPKGYQHSIQRLQGTTTIPDVFDIELLTDLFYSIIGMPKSWFGIGNSDGANAPSGKSLLAQDIRFLRKVRSIRRPIIAQYTWLATFHAILSGRAKDDNLESLNIQAKMSDIGSLEDHMKMELLDLQADVISKLADIMQQYNLPKETWTELIFKRYLRLPDEIVNVFLTSLPAPASVEEPMESVHSSAPPSSAVLLEKISDRLCLAKASILIKIRSIMDSSHVDRTEKKTYKSFTEVFGFPSIMSNDRLCGGMDSVVSKSVSSKLSTVTRSAPQPINEGSVSKGKNSEGPSTITIQQPQFSVEESVIESIRFKTVTSESSTIVDQNSSHLPEKTRRYIRLK